MLFSPKAEEAARTYMLSKFPEEGCGIIAGDEFIPVVNVARNKRDSFQMPDDTYARYKVQGVVHSHCSDRHSRYPSAADMQGQIDSGVPWGLVWTSDEQPSEILWWGDFRLDDELIERPFIPGVYDCYSLLRSVMWQDRGIKLPEFPRDEDWWDAGKDLFMKGFRKAGARLVSGPYEPGDALLMTILSDGVVNHCAYVRENGLILHHLRGQLSRQEPIGRWREYVAGHLRYVG